MPLPVLLALSYESSWWESHHAHPSVSGGYGLLHLTATAAAHTADLPPTLDQAASLTGASLKQLRTEDRQNIRGGAALLASYEKSLVGTYPRDPARWYGAVARYSQAATARSAGLFADRVYTIIREGLQHVRPDGQRIRLAASAVTPDRSQLTRLGLRPNDVATGAECPANVTCRFTPAATDNYQVSNRPANGLAPLYIVIHVVDGSYSSAIDTFQDPDSRLSAHYVMRSSDGAVTQMVANKDVAFHSGNYWFNLHSIGIEHEGFPVQGATWFTPTQYQATADLVRHLSARYHIPLDREHVIGHDNVPGASRESISDMHWDPGPYWDWTRFMSLLTQLPAPALTGSPHTGEAVTISPDFATNRQSVQVCGQTARAWSAPLFKYSQLPAGCTTQSEPSNFLPVHTGPSQDTALFPDPALHPGEDSGTSLIEDWGNTVTAGQQFIVADQKEDWTAIWFSGRVGWIFNPGGRNTRRANGPLHLIRPRAGRTSIPVYGTGYPMPNAYPQGWPPSAQSPQGLYALSAGQTLVATTPVAADDFSARHPPGTVVASSERYVTAQFNHRLALLNSADTEPTGPSP